MADRLEDLIADALRADAMANKAEPRPVMLSERLAEALAPLVVLREDLQQVGAYFVDDSLVIVYRIRGGMNP